MGAESVKELLKNIDLEKESETLKEELEGATGQKRVRITRRMKY